MIDFILKPEHRVVEVYNYRCEQIGVLSVGSGNLWVWRKNSYHQELTDSELEIITQEIRRRNKPLLARL